MAETTYSYVKNVKPTLLQSEIEASAITITLVRIDTFGTGPSMNVDITFIDPLSAGEQVILDGLVAAHVAIQTFRELQVWESNPGQTTTMETWQTGISRTSQQLADGPYMLGWYAELKLDPTGPINSRASARFSIDGNVKGSHATVLDDWVVFTGWDRYIANEGDEPVLAIEFRRDPGVGGNDSVTIRKLKLKIEVIRR